MKHEKELQARETNNRWLWINRKAIVFFLAGIVMTSVASSCNQNIEPTVAGMRHPFNIEIVSEDGAHVALEGYTDGYAPGMVESTQLGIKNNTGQLWPGRMCISLLEPRSSGAVFPLDEREFTLAPGEGFEDTIRFQIPADLPSGRYGLAMVVRQPAGPVVTVTSIQVGKVGESRPARPQPADTWPSEDAIEACQ